MVRAAIFSQATGPMLGILALGVLLRCWNVNGLSYWFDEKITVCNSQGLDVWSPHTPSAPTGQLGGWLNKVVSANVRDDSGNGILNTLGFRVWSEFFGAQEGGGRLYAAALSVVLILLVFFIARQLYGPKCGLLASFLLAIHPLAVYHGREVRAYNLAAIAVASGFVVSLKIIDSENTNGRQYLLFGVLAGAAALTHYLSVWAFIVFACMILCLRGRRSASGVSLSVLVGGLVLGSWLVSGGSAGFVRMNERAQRILHSQVALGLTPSPYNVAAAQFEVVLPFAGLLTTELGMRLRDGFPLVPFLAIGMAPLVRRDWKTPKFRWLALCAASGLVLSTLLAYQSGHILSFQPRYSYWYLPIFLAVFAEAAREAWVSRNKVAFLCLGLVVSCWAASLYAVIVDLRFQRGPLSYGQVLGRIEREARSPITVFLGYRPAASLLRAISRERVRVELDSRLMAGEVLTVDADGETTRYFVAESTFDESQTRHTKGRR